MKTSFLTIGLAACFAAANAAESILLEASPETSMSWHTLTAAKGQAVAWEWPAGALSARLTVVSSDGTVVSEALNERSVGTCTFAPALPDTAENERTYSLRLDFFMTSNATGTPITGETLTAENVGVVRGVDGAAGDMIGRGTAASSWCYVRGGSAVLPVPAGSTSLALDGKKVALDGSFGWRALCPVVPDETYEVALGGTEAAEVTLIGHRILGTLITIR